MSTYKENLIKARRLLGSYNAVGIVCGGITGKAVMKWRDQGRPPRTEYTGETCYAQMIETATGGEVRASDLLPNVQARQRS